MAEDLKKHIVTTIASKQDAEKNKKSKTSKSKKAKKYKKKTNSSLMLGHNAQTTSRVPDLALKIYDEQLLDAKDRDEYECRFKKLMKMKDAGKSNTPEYLHKLKEQHDLVDKVSLEFAERVHAIDKNKYAVLTIRHDKDTVRDPDDLFEVAIKKPHWHIWVWSRKLGAPVYETGKLFRIHTMVCGDDKGSRYLGLYYDGKKDAKMWDHRGAERIHNVIACVAYALHVSSSAIAKGKHIYSINELVTNLSMTEVKQMLKLYKGAYNHYKNKLYDEDWNILAETARDRGRALQDFDSWADDHFMISQQANKNFRVVRKYYDRGLQEGLSNAPHIDRLNVFILGEGNLGKSYNSQKALLDMGVERIVNAPYGTGKYDGVTADTQAILFDDSRMTQAKTVMEQKPVILHRRNNGDPVWKGQHVIYTSNFASPIDAAADCLGYQPYKDDDGTLKYTDKQMLDINPVIQRAFFCTVELDTDPNSANYGHFHLVLLQRANRGGAKQIERLNAMFEQFRSAFDKSIYDYDAEPVLEFQAKIRTEKEIKQRIDNNENVVIPRSINGYDYDNIKGDNLPLDIDFELRADLKGQADAWDEYSDRLNHQYRKDVPNNWADMITRENNKKLADLEKYSSEPMYLDDALGQDDQQKVMTFACDQPDDLDQKMYCEKMGISWLEPGEY